MPAFNSRRTREICWGGDGTVVSPDSVRVKLPFEQVLEPAPTLGSLYLYQYRGNSAYDPDYTGVGGQPTGFDQWSAFFNEYTVISSSIEVEIISGQNYSVEYVVYPSYNVSSPATSLDASMRPYAERCLMTGNGNATHKVLKSQMSTAQMMGVRPEAVLDDDAYGATISTSPASTAIWYWNVVAQNVSNTTTLNDCVRVHIVYDVLFHDRVQLASSLPQSRSAPNPGVGAAAAKPSAVLATLSQCLRELASTGASAALPPQTP